MYQTYYMEALNLQLGSIGHRSKKFREIYQHTDTQLRQLLQLPTSHYIFFTGSASEIWERMLVSVVQQYSFHLVQGDFSKRFYTYAQKLQKTPAIHEVAHGLGFDIDKIDIPDAIELICTTQNETSSGVQIPTEDLVQLKKKYPSKLLCTDIVSSAPIIPIDYRYVDSSFFSVQKCFGMPPGLGVWIVNDACIQQSTKVTNARAHHTLESFYTNYKKMETPSTPNIIAIYILGKIAENFNTRAINNIREESKQKANLLYNTIANSSLLKLAVENKLHRSETVVVANCIQGNESILKQLHSKQMHISSGYNNYKTSQVRIANFPAMHIENIEKLCNAIK